MSAVPKSDFGAGDTGFSWTLSSVPAFGEAIGGSAGAAFAAEFTGTSFGGARIPPALLQASTSFM
ncbi:hypothetical protein HYPDE_33278 [Hyphomicrobium denitrificans 1NES1]|uniref:Uncharacterized protein n=1 Tax=Hyphomicrobium denitrificans 1NES1 TaxID=670307 RepID=N0B5M5_9HYPH|nr:hypothetical protein HYPDE_33278 [Hyphomicrobium denitrificans 1NES1]